MWRIAMHSRTLLQALCIFAGTALVALLCFSRPAMLEKLDLAEYDWFMLRHATDSSRSSVLVVDIDEPSLEKYGQWPWSRRHLAHILRTITDNGGRAVALDFPLFEEDRTSPKNILQALWKGGCPEAVLEGVPDVLMDHDALMARAVRNCPAVMGMQLGDFPPVKDAPMGVHVRLLGEAIQKNPPQFPAFPSLLRPLPAFRGLASEGFLNGHRDVDGRIRRTFSLAESGGVIYPGLTLRTLLRSFNANIITMRRTMFGLRACIAGRFFFVAEDGTIPIPFHKQLGRKRTLSAGKLLDGTYDPRMFKDKIVFIGSSADRVMGQFSTPLDDHTPRMEAHASLVDGILSGEIRTIVSNRHPFQYLLILGVGLVSGVGVLRLRPWMAPLLPLFLIVACHIGASICYAGGLWFSPLWASLSAVVNALLPIVLRTGFSEHDRLRIRRMFGQYVSPDVVSRIIDQGTDGMGGEQREITVLFTDLRGFTSISEMLTPQQVVALLNRYFTPMTELVRRSGGTLDKYIGDALMAFWNAPLDTEHHTLLAVDTALQMQKTLEDMNAELRRDFGVSLIMGVGIHVGMAAVGNIGSRNLTSYTAVGDTVNIASRLEGLCREYNVTIVASDAVMQACEGRAQGSYLDSVRVKGRSGGIGVWSITGLAPVRPTA
ncbi:MAG: adenylate/guanylate cyclase domain-containing protein [Desulfovibrio desulfuricans]|jgi:adenylate cyclase|nr:adenylate/guanylate cyclase domain-containing protein [Desulfovibrio desulfuricans]